MSKTPSLRLSIALGALGALFFIPFLGGVHLFDWDEINFAEISREMLILGDYTRVHVNFEPFFQKPPFFFWLQALAMKAFGVGDFAARLPNAICGILTLVLIFRIGQHLKGVRFGLLWAGAYFGSVLPFLYFKSGIIDPWFNLFIFLGLYGLIRFYWQKEGLETGGRPGSKWQHLFLGGLWIGMAMLTKGQAAYLILVLTLGVYWIYQRLRLYISIPQFLFFTLAAALVTLACYGLETAKNGPAFIYEFNRYQYRLFSTPDAGHGGFPGYHFVVLLVGCFPASIFAIRAFFPLPGNDDARAKDFQRWMKILFWVVLILFSIVKSKIVHYSSLAYFPLTYLAALSIEQLLAGKIPLNKWMRAGLWTVGGLFILATTALPFIAKQAEALKPLLSDPFAQGNLEAKVNWTGLEALSGLFLLGLLLAFFRLFRRNRRQRSFLALFGGTAVFVMLALFFYIKRVEGYSQRAAVEFFQEKAAEDCHLAVHGYKSYAHLYYGRVAGPGQACFTDADCIEQLLTGPISKPVYIVSKVHRAHELLGRGDLQEIRRKNGFVFFQRLPQQQQPSPQ
jgi:4-amino-4-deoxy-L-arabinose transferase-like glycosyltransferase